MLRKRSLHFETEMAAPDPDSEPQRAPEPESSTGECVWKQGESAAGAKHGSGAQRSASRWLAIRIADAPPEKPIYEGVNWGIAGPPAGRLGEIPVARKKKPGFRLTRPSLLMEASRTVRLSDQIRHGYDLVLDWTVTARRRQMTEFGSIRL